MSAFSETGKATYCHVSRSLNLKNPIFSILGCNRINLNLEEWAPSPCAASGRSSQPIGSTARRGMAALRGIEEHGAAFRARFATPSLEPISLGQPAPRPRAPTPEPQPVNFQDEGARAWARAGAWASDAWASAWPRSDGDAGAGAVRRSSSHAQTAREEASAIDVDAALRHQAAVDDDAPPPPTWYEELEHASQARQARVAAFATSTANTCKNSGAVAVTSLVATCSGGGKHRAGPHHQFVSRGCST